MSSVYPVFTSLGITSPDPRQRLGITQYQLAKRTGRSVQHLSQIEHGKSEPRISTVIMLAKALGVDIGDFVREVAIELELEKPLT